MEKSGGINEKSVKAGEFWVKSGKRENEGKLGDLATLMSLWVFNSAFKSIGFIGKVAYDPICCFSLSLIRWMILVYIWF